MAVQALIYVGQAVLTSTSKLIVAYNCQLDNGMEFGGTVTATSKDAKTLLSAIQSDAVARSPVPISLGDIITFGGPQ